MRSRHGQVIGAILLKDFNDGLRDARVIIPILIPIILGLFYSVATSSSEKLLPKATVVYVTGSPTRLPAQVNRLARGALAIARRRAATPAAARAVIAAGDAALGVVVPAGFDADARAGRHPNLQLLAPRPPTTSTGLVAGIVNRAAMQIAGQQPAVIVQTASVTVAKGSTAASIDRLGIRIYEVLAVTILLLVMIGVSVTPTVMSDEVQSKTIDALLLVASYVDVIVAKAGFGIVTSLVGVPVLLVLARQQPANVPVFAVVVVLSAIVLVGLGLLLGSYLRTQGQLSVWSNLVFFPLIGAMILATINLPWPGNALLTILPTAPMIRLAGNAMAGEAVFPYGALSWISLAAWVVLTYGALWWRLRRIEA